MSAYIKALDYYLPEKILTNEEIVKEFPEWSVDKIAKKVGVTCILANNICAYVDTSLLGQMLTWKLDGVTGQVVTYDGRKTGTI